MLHIYEYQQRGADRFSTLLIFTLFRLQSISPPLNITVLEGAALLVLFYADISKTESSIPKLFLDFATTKRTKVYTMCFFEMAWSDRR